MKKMSKKCSTDQSFIWKRNTTYKIGTLVFSQFLRVGTVLRKGCASLRPKFENFLLFQDTVPAQKNEKIFLNFEHGTNLDNSMICSPTCEDIFIKIFFFKYYRSI